MPIGFNKQGLPVSITFLSNLFREEELLQAGAYFQSITNHEDKHPERFKQ
jgi:Asp-tRNA(Asn)/Glu-tRNA(Gln) amidotransferase A subunit family amidase